MYCVDENENIPNFPGVYLLLCLINGKIYVGKANDLRKRIFYHSRVEYHKTTKKSHICNAIKKHGWENFAVYFLDTFSYLNISELLEREAQWIRILDARNPQIGYNLCEYASDSTGRKMTTEQKKKISKSLLATDLPQRGRNLSKQTKQLLSEAMKAKNWVGYRNPFYGKTHGKALKRKLSKLMKERQKAGVYNKQKKKVKQIDPKTGGLIKIWDSQFQAAKELNISNKDISRVCVDPFCKNGFIRVASGFHWQFA